MPHLKLKGKRCTYSFSTPETVCQKGHEPACNTNTAGIVETRRVCFTSFSAQRKFFTKSRLTSFTPFPQSNRFKPLMQKGEGDVQKPNTLLTKTP